MRAFVPSALFCVLASGALVAQKTPLWIRHPAISPDGKSIVFCYQGDLYSVPTQGGTAKPLTVDGSHHSNPVWSHDGKHLAFASDRAGNLDVYVMPAQGGETRRLTFHSANDVPLSFSPDDREILFLSNRQQASSSRQFPSGGLSQTYRVSVEGGEARLLSTHAMEAAVFDPSGKTLLYQDLKGYEDPWRKHHTSAVARDIWQFELASGTYTQLTDFAGEDRNPVFGSEGGSYFYLNEQSGSFNVVRGSLKGGEAPALLTHFTRHPVRFLSAARDNTLCFTYDGELYTQRPGGQPVKVGVSLSVDGRSTQERILPVNGGISEMALSPNGKEVAYIVRGEVFVSSVDGKVTRRITSTAGQERSVGFSPDGRTLVYAAERGKSWDIYTCKLVRKEEPYFYASTLLEEKPLVATEADEFQPLFSPDGKEVAFLEERTGLKVLNLESRKTRTILQAGRNYSYADGDQSFTWSPDSKWLLLSINTGLGWLRDVALMSAEGDGVVHNLSRSGFADDEPRFSPDGTMVYWTTDREGYRNLGQKGTTSDIYGVFLTKAAWDRFQLSKEDFALVKEQEDKDTEAKAKADKDAKKEAKPQLELVKIDWEGLEDRRARLTTHTTTLGDAVVNKAGDALYYLARFEKGFDLWSTDLRTHENKLVAKLGANRVGMEASRDGKFLLIQADGKLVKIEAESGKREDLVVAGELVNDPRAERAYIFEHAWRQVVKKFYVVDLQGVDWPFYHDAYQKFLPHVANNVDFQDLLSEMLGELNASHTGARFRAAQPNTDATAGLGLCLAPTEGKGLRIADVLKDGPLDLAGSKVRPGHRLMAIDGVELGAGQDHNALLNRKAGQRALLAFADDKTGQRWEEVVKPISLDRENELFYRRWVEQNRREVEQRSKGRLGYVHVRSMSDPSMRTVMDEALGRYPNAEAIVVDTRFNGGGNIHEQLSDFLSGKKYFDVIPHGQAYGRDPLMKWTKPSIVLVNEGCYSDAHLFPVAYRLKGLGKILGMPVPGTGTFVWWETQIDPTLVFGIPQGGWRTPDGKFCENNQLEPDIRVPNSPALLAKGRDQQLEKAVDTLLEGLARH